MLEALDLSAGLLWGMLTCPRDAVLRSRLSFSFQQRPVPDIPLYFFPLSPRSCAHSYVYSIISFSFSRGRERARLTEVTPIDPPG